MKEERLYSAKKKKDSPFFNAYFAPIENIKINEAVKYLPNKEFSE